MLLPLARYYLRAGLVPSLAFLFSIPLPPFTSPRKREHIEKDTAFPICSLFLISIFLSLLFYLFTSFQPFLPFAFFPCPCFSRLFRSVVSFHSPSLQRFPIMFLSSPWAAVRFANGWSLPLLFSPLPLLPLSSLVNFSFFPLFSSFHSIVCSSFGFPAFNLLFPPPLFPVPAFPVSPFFS